MKGNTYRIYNKNRRYQQVVGNYPDQIVLKEFPDLTSVLGFAFERGHLEDGSYNFLQFVIGTIKASSIDDTELVLECHRSANNEVYKNRAVRMLERHIREGRGWQTYLSDKED